MSQSSVDSPGPLDYFEMMGHITILDPKMNKIYNIYGQLQYIHIRGVVL